MDPARVVAAGYDAVADRYAALEEQGSEWPRSRRIAELTKSLPAGASVLELGCGNGVPVARDLAAAGFVVTGVDVSQEQIRRARQAAPEGRFVVSDMLTAELPKEAFDAVVCLYAIEHVPRDRHLDVFGRIRVWLRPGGLALVAIEDADEPGVVAEWLGSPMYFSACRAAEECLVAETAGLQIVGAEVESQLEQGREVPYLWLLARRPGSGSKPAQ